MESILDGELTCAVCLELLDDPHQFPCGHSYCRSCINDLRDSEDYRCPECRREFPRSCNVFKNYSLAKVISACRKHERPAEGGVTRETQVKPQNNIRSNHKKEPGHNEKWLLLSSLLAFTLLMGVFFDRGEETLEAQGETAAVNPGLPSGYDANVHPLVKTLISLPLFYIWLFLRLLQILLWVLTNLLWLISMSIYLVYLCLSFLLPSIQLFLSHACDII